VIAVSIGPVFLIGTLTGNFPFVSGAAAILMLLPLVLAHHFSRRLLNAGVSDRNYIKGTSTAREVLVYWMVGVVVFLGTGRTESGSQTVQVVLASLASTLTLVAIARMATNGYKEYREALATAPPVPGPPTSFPRTRLPSQRAELKATRFPSTVAALIPIVGTLPLMQRLHFVARAPISMTPSSPSRNMKPGPATSPLTYPI
jgi:hypothetical protein